LKDKPPRHSIRQRLTFENIPFRSSRLQTVWGGFDGQVFSADLDFICSASSDRSRRRISAADIQLMRFAMALKITLYGFIIRSIAAAGIVWLGSTLPASTLPLKRGQITC